MKRTPLKTKTRLERKTRLKQVNPKRRARAFERNYGQRGDPIRAMQCAVRSHSSSATRCSGRIEAAHVVARGMGGCNGDRRDLVPLCSGHHLEQGAIGILSFQRKYGIDLAGLAAALARQMDEAGYA